MPTLLDLAPEHAAVAATLSAGLSRVEEIFERQLRSELPPVEDLCRHVERYRGKMLRPTMTLLAGLAAAPADAAEPLTEAHLTLAAVTEMVHVATLVHDDVLDDAETRRGGATINNLRGNEAAVILGDYLIARSFHLCSSLESQFAALLIGEITSRVCEGELLQLHHRDDYSLDEATYEEIIRRKTASLIGVACELGAWLSGANEDLRRRLRDFGVCIGVAFQIRDDLLDITGDERVVGKSLGKDLEKGKLTLPLIHHLAVATPARRGETLALLEDYSSPRDHAAVLAALKATGSLEHALSAAARFVAEARAALTALRPSPARALLEDLAQAVLSRER